MFLTVKPPKPIQSIAMAGTAHTQIRPTAKAMSSAFFMSIYLLSFFCYVPFFCRFSRFAGATSPFYFFSIMWGTSSTTYCYHLTAYFLLLRSCLLTFYGPLLGSLTTTFPGLSSTFFMPKKRSNYLISLYYFFVSIRALHPAIFFLGPRLARFLSK